MTKRNVILLMVLMLVFPCELILAKASICTKVDSVQVNRSSDEEISAKYDDSAPQAKESEGKKRKNVLGKIVFWTLHAAAIGGLAWYFFINPKSPLKKKENTNPCPQPKEEGSYIGVTVRFMMKCKGLNVMSKVANMGSVTISCDLDNQQIPELYIDNFRIEDVVPNPTCDQAKLIVDKYADIVFNKKNFTVKFWFYGKQIDKNYDPFLCYEYSITPVAYTYDKSKTDPGMPVLLGMDQFKMHSIKYLDLDDPVSDRKLILGYYTDMAYIYIVKPDQVNAKRNETK